MKLVRSEEEAPELKQRNPFSRFLPLEKAKIEIKKTKEKALVVQFSRQPPVNGANPAQHLKRSESSKKKKNGKDEESSKAKQIWGKNGERSVT